MRSALILTLLLAAPRMSATEVLKARDAEVRALLPKPGEELSPSRRDQIESVLVRTVDLEGGDRVIVPTVLVVKGEPTHVNYALQPTGDSWKIVDIIIDEVSTVENYRASFSKVIAQEGFDALIHKLANKKS